MQMRLRRANVSVLLQQCEKWTHSTWSTTTTWSLIFWTPAFSSRAFSTRAFSTDILSPDTACTRHHSYMYMCV